MKRCVYCDSGSVYIHSYEARTIYDLVDGKVLTIDFPYNRYRCNDCGKTFADIGPDTIIKGVSDRLVDYIAHMSMSMSVREITKELNGIVSKSTVNNIRNIWKEQHSRDALDYDALLKIPELAICTIRLAGENCYAICNARDGYLIDVYRPEDLGKVIQVMQKATKIIRTPERVYVDDLIALTLVHGVYGQEGYKTCYVNYALLTHVNRILIDTISSSKTIANEKKKDLLDMLYHPENWDEDYLDSFFEKYAKRDQSVLNAYTVRKLVKQMDLDWLEEQGYKQVMDACRGVEILKPVADNCALIDDVISSSFHEPFPAPLFELLCSIDENIKSYPDQSVEQCRMRLVLTTRPKVETIRSKKTYHGIDVNAIKTMLASQQKYDAMRKK